MARNEKNRIRSGPIMEVYTKTKQKKIAASESNETKRGYTVNLFFIFFNS
jgi:hypothetical protein